MPVEACPLLGVSHLNCGTLTPLGPTLEHREAPLFKQHILFTSITISFTCT